MTEGIAIEIVKIDLGTESYCPDSQVQNKIDHFHDTIDRSGWGILNTGVSIPSSPVQDRRGVLISNLSSFKENRA
ncbi:hypothetical protein [Chamaesiphon sp.]|uniref:hypothetical protein n=1 Tax=Chamaesiphon sp. TaxID=2814140 RepID=UPI0035940ADB